MSGPLLPGVRFGDESTDKLDWRDLDGQDDDADDDELLAETPPDVVAMLGFDPLELEDDDGDDQGAQGDDVSRGKEKRGARG